MFTSFSIHSSTPVNTLTPFIGSLVSAPAERGRGVSCVLFWVWSADFHERYWRSACTRDHRKVKSQTGHSPFHWTAARNAPAPTHSRVLQRSNLQLRSRRVCEDLDGQNSHLNADIRAPLLLPLHWSDLISQQRAHSRFVLEGVVDRPPPPPYTHRSACSALLRATQPWMA